MNGHRSKSSALWKGRSFAAALLMLFGLTHVSIASPAAFWDTYSDTWVATDGLGRALPLPNVAGGPRPDKTVAVFYFLWLGQHGQAGPFDISKILAQAPSAINNPKSPLWGPLQAFHHWGESIFGYYVFDDEAVLRKHSQMLADAGVDVVIFDVTNQLTYPGSWQALCRVWARMRREGNKTPQIAFLCPFGDPRKVVRELWEQLYSQNLYPELWFQWQGKPLILADPGMLRAGVTFSRHDSPVELKPGHTLGQSISVREPVSAIGGSFPTWAKRDSAATLTLMRGGPNGEKLAKRRFKNLADNGWTMLEFPTPLQAGTYYLEISDPKGPVGWWSTAINNITNGQAFADGDPAPGDRAVKIVLANDQDHQIKNFFTFRKPQPDYFVGPTGPNQWSWLEVHPQHVFTNEAGVPEQVGVGVGQNAVDGKLSVLSNPRSHGRSFHDGKEPGPEGRDFSGRNFAEQWRRALAVDPPFIFVTGWNEWIAMRFDNKAPFYGSGPVTFVDQFNQEFSRDIEPMKGGHGDAYYYQMISNIRHYKGVHPLAPVITKPILLDGRFEDWAGVEPEFRDTIGDPVKRDHRDWSGTQRYRNQTGRNDIVAAKVSYDVENIYFYARTQAPLSPPTGPSWMLLFLDVDNNPTNGWLGYDFVVNHAGVQVGKVSVERNLGGYRWGNVGQGTIRYLDRELELTIPRSTLGLTKAPEYLDFKWADNIQQTGEWSDFTLNGDAAPNDRFNYRAIFSSGPK